MLLLVVLRSVNRTVSVTSPSPVVLGPQFQLFRDEQASLGDKTTETRLKTHGTRKQMTSSVGLRREVRTFFLPRKSHRLALHSEPRAASRFLAHVAVLAPLPRSGNDCPTHLREGHTEAGQSDSTGFECSGTGQSPIQVRL